MPPETKKIHQCPGLMCRWNGKEELRTKPVGEGYETYRLGQIMINSIAACHKGSGASNPHPGKWQNDAPQEDPLHMIVSCLPLACLSGCLVALTHRSALHCPIREQRKSIRVDR